MSDIIKAASIEGQKLDETELAEINRYSMKQLTEDEVFVFRLVACGNDVDRDNEAFPRSALEKLAQLLVGKTVIENHTPKAENQRARIYRAAVEAREGVAETGEPYAQLVLCCYMARTESNRDYIAEIEAGIKKEVSIGCSVSSVVCSICGRDNIKADCGHRPGKEYGGKLCYMRLEEPNDAYEVSFVAVPAQPEAGVVKSYGGKKEVGTVAARLKAAFKKTEG